MRYKNLSNSYLPIGNNAFLGPYSITKDMTKEEVTANQEISTRIARGVLVEYTGPDPVMAPKKKVDARYEIDPVVVNGKLVTNTTTKNPVQYIVADPEGVDGVSMDAGDSVNSMGKNYKESPDYIESGVDAGKFKNAADAMEAELNKEFEDGTFDDEENITESDAERPEGEDADEAIAKDAQQFLQSQGKNGAEVTTAKEMIQKSVTSEMAKVNQAVSANLDNGESVANASPKVTDFLKQPMNAKKFIIAKETDPNFLNEVDGVSQSDTVKQLVKQRLEELK